MKRIVFFKKLRAKYAGGMARFKERSGAWQREQANDWAIWERDPRKEQMQEAIAAYNAAPDVGFQRFLALAEQGSVWSMLQVALSYHYGKGILRDPALAEDWSRRAFEGGSESAQLQYGRYLWLRGNFAKCEEVFGVGAANDWAPALLWLAYSRLRRCNTRQTLREVRPLLERASAKGCIEAQYVLAKRMARGWFGLREIPRGHQLLWRLQDVMTWD